MTKSIKITIISIIVLFITLGAINFDKVKFNTFQYLFFTQEWIIKKPHQFKMCFSECGARNSRTLWDVDNYDIKTTCYFECEKYKE